MSFLPTKEGWRHIALDAARWIRGGMVSDIQAIDPAKGNKLFATQRVPAGTLKLPPTKAETLSGRTLLLPLNKPFVLSLAFNSFAYESLGTWREPLSKINLARVELSIAMSWSAPYVRDTLEAELRRVVPRQMHDVTCLYTESFIAQRRALGIMNRATPYVFLVRPSGDVVVMASGKFDPRADQLLFDVVEREEEEAAEH